MEDNKDLRGLRVFTPDRRELDTWAFDDAFCQRLAEHRRPSWKTALQRYWRERCSRRELANELGLSLDAIKSLLATIRKAARDGRDGQRRVSWSDGDGQAPRQCHSKITAADIYAICDGDPDAIAHMEEYGRLNIIERLNMFSPAISGELIKTLQHSDAIGDSQREDITSRLVATAVCNLHEPVHAHAYSRHRRRERRHAMEGSQDWPK